MIRLEPTRLQEAAQAAGEGLPFWLFWFLLCIILLLIVFITLRDKDLRRRMSSFLSGARRKMIRLRLQVKVRKQETKKAGLLRELGEKAWDLDLSNERAEPLRKRLEGIEDEIQTRQRTWHELITAIDGLNARLQEIRRKFEESLRLQEGGRKPHIDEMTGLMKNKETLMEAFSRAKEELEAARYEAGSLEKEIDAVQKNPKMQDGEKAAKIEKIGDASTSLGEWIKETQGKIVLLEAEQSRVEDSQENLQSRIDLFNDEIRRLDSLYRAETKEIEDEIRTKEAEKSKIEKDIIGLKENMAPLFVNLGKALENSRLPEPEFEILYLEIDGAVKTIRDLKSQIEKLR